MQVPHEKVPVLLVQRHEGPPHDDELDFVDVVAKSFELLDAVFGLDVGVVSADYFAGFTWLLWRACWLARSPCSFGLSTRNPNLAPFGKNKKLTPGQ